MKHKHKLNLKKKPLLLSTMIIHFDVVKALNHLIFSPIHKDFGSIQIADSKL